MRTLQTHTARYHNKRHHQVLCPKPLLKQTHRLSAVLWIWLRMLTFGPNFAMLKEMVPLSTKDVEFFRPMGGASSTAICPCFDVVSNFGATSSASKTLTHFLLRVYLPGSTSTRDADGPSHKGQMNEC